VIIPTILGVIFVVLLPPAPVCAAPIVLVVANVLSFAADHRVSALVFNHVFHFPGSDPSTPLYGFVFLVALGIDYSIFLMTRVREESRIRGTRPGILVGLAVTGASSQRRHRSRVDVLGAGGAPDPVPGADRLHRRLRRPPRHRVVRSLLVAGSLLRPRRPSLVAVRAASGRRPEQSTCA
jgi:hypothetical protein